jgi:hypothetical protein
LSDKAEAEVIQIHLRDHSPVCTECAQEAFRFWAVFGAAHGLGSNAVPGPGVRVKFLESIGSAAHPAPEFSHVGDPGRFMRLGWSRRKLSEAEREVGALAETSARPIVPVRLNPASADCSLEVDRALGEANQQIQQLRTTISGEQAKSSAQEFDQQAGAVFEGTP